MSLHQRTKDLLAQVLATGYTLQRIVKESNGSVHYEWIKKFNIDFSKDPGVNRTEALHDELVRILKAQKRKS